VIVTEDGIVLSQWHVSHWRRDPSDERSSRIDNSSTYSAGEKTVVILHDGRECRAELLGADRNRDVSLLRLLEPGPYPHVPIRPENQVRVGDWVLKLGHPLGYRRDRSAPVRLGRVLSRIDEIFSTDCAGSGGDSGGPYFNLDGQLVGIAGEGGGQTWLALTPEDPLFALRAVWSMKVTAAPLIHDLFDGMRRGEVSPVTVEQYPSMDGRLAAAEHLRVADWSQGSATLAVYRSIVQPARSSVVVILNQGVAVALGTVVGAEGWVITKASELPPDPTCRLPDGRIVPGRVVGAEPAFDLALLKLPAHDLWPVAWAREFDPPVGTLLAAVGTEEQPLAVGMVSVPRRDLPDPSPPTYTLPLRVAACRPEIYGSVRRNEGRYLREIVGMDRPSSYRVAMAFGRAWSAGVRPGDRLLKVDGRPVRGDEDVVDAVKGRLSGDLVSVELERDGEAIERPLPLGAVPKLLGHRQNYRADDFPTVLECAVPFFSHECGGPIVDLSGRAVGISIAVLGAHGGMVVPGDCVLRLLPDLQAGKLAGNWTPDRASGK
jgi:serine protease Do